MTTIGGQISHGFKHAAHKVGHEAEKAGDAIKGGAGSAKHGLDKLNPKKEIEKLVKKAVKEVETGVTKKLPKLAEKAFEDALKKATSGAVKKGLNTALDVIELLSPNSFSLVLGFEVALVIQTEFTISVEIPNPVARLPKIRKWAKRPPRGRAKLIACISDFAPSSLTIEAKFSGNGGSATWDGDDKFKKLDKFLKKQGV